MYMWTCMYLWMWWVWGVVKYREIVAITERVDFCASKRGDSSDTWHTCCVNDIVTRPSLLKDLNYWTQAFYCMRNQCEIDSSNSASLSIYSRWKIVSRADFIKYIYLRDFQVLDDEYTDVKEFLLNEYCIITRISWR